MLTSINFKERISLSTKSHQNFQTHSPNVLSDLSNNLKANTPVFLDAIFNIMIAPQQTPAERFYALYLLLKATENNPGQEFLIKLSFKEDLTSYISQTAQYDMDKVLSTNERGKTYFSKNPSASEANIGVNYVRLSTETIMYWGETYGKSDANNIFYNFWFQNQIVSKRVSLDSKPIFVGKTYQGIEELASHNFSQPISVPKSKNLSQSGEMASPAFPIQRLESQGSKAGVKAQQQGNQETVIKSLGKVEVGKDVMIGNLPQVNNDRTDSATFQANAQDLQAAKRAERLKELMKQDAQETNKPLARSNTGGFLKNVESPAVDQRVNGSLMNIRFDREVELKKTGDNTPRSPMTYSNAITPKGQGTPVTPEQNKKFLNEREPDTPKKEQDQNTPQNAQNVGANPLANNPYLRLQFDEKFNRAVNERHQSMTQAKTNNDPLEIFKLNSDVVNLNKGLNDSRASYRSQNSQLGQGKSVNIVFSDKGEEEFVDFNDSIFYRDQNSVPQQDLLNVLNQSQGTKGKQSVGNNSKQHQPQEEFGNDMFKGNVDIGRINAPVRVKSTLGKPGPSSKGALETGAGAGAGAVVSQKVEARSPQVQQAQPQVQPQVRSQADVKSPTVQDPNVNLEFYQQNPQILMHQNQGYKEENTYLMGELARYQQELKRKEEKEKFLAKQNHFLKERVAGFDQELSELRKTIGKLADSNQQLHRDLLVQGTGTYNSPVKNSGMGEYLNESPVKNNLYAQGSYRSVQSPEMGEYLNETPIRNSDVIRKNIFDPVSYERPSAVLRASNYK